MNPFEDFHFLFLLWSSTVTFIYIYPHSVTQTFKSRCFIGWTSVYITSWGEKKWVIIAWIKGQLSRWSQCDQNICFTLFGGRKRLTSYKCTPLHVLLIPYPYGLYASWLKWLVAAWHIYGGLILIPFWRSISMLGWCHTVYKGLHFDFRVGLYNSPKC